jgi:hypothetical protein
MIGAPAASEGVNLGRLLFWFGVSFVAVGLLPDDVPADRRGADLARQLVRAAFRASPDLRTQRQED